MKPALLFGRLDLAGASYKLLNFEVTLERQRAAVCEVSTEEPVEVDKTGVISLGRWGDLFPAAAVKVTECRQVGDRRFEVEVVGLARLILDQPTALGLRKVGAEMALAKLASEVGLAFASLAPPVLATPRDMVFAGSFRGALDQIASCFGFKEERWHLDVQNKKLMLLPGFAPGVPVVLDPRMILEATSDQIEAVPLPRLRPFGQIIHLGEPRTVDKVVFDSNWQSMTMELVQ